MRVENDIDHARVEIAEQDTLPCFAAIRGAEDSSLVVGAEGVPEGCDESNIRVLGVNDNSADATRVGEADMLPGLARIE